MLDQSGGGGGGYEEEQESRVTWLEYPPLPLIRPDLAWGRGEKGGEGAGPLR